jgi:hypothetical protein
MGVLWPQFWSALSSPSCVSPSSPERTTDRDREGGGGGGGGGTVVVGAGAGAGGGGAVVVGGHIAKPELLLNTVKLATNDIVRYCAIQLTFGLTSPVLTIAVMVSCCLKLSFWMMMIGRFLYHRVNLKKSSVSNDETEAPSICTTEERNTQLNTDDHALISLTQTFIDIPSVFSSCFWPIVGSSSCFIAAISWDMAADRVKVAEDALWAPLTVLSVPILLWLFEVGVMRGLLYHHNTKEICVEDSKISSRVEIEIIATAVSNPLSERC